MKKEEKKQKESDDSIKQSIKEIFEESQNLTGKSDTSFLADNQYNGWTSYSKGDFLC